MSRGTPRRLEILDDLVGLGIEDDEVVGLLIADEDEAGVLGGAAHARGNEKRGGKAEDDNERRQPFDKHE
jgi:hypothetical protein